jgi:hypothetical protein
VVFVFTKDPVVEAVFLFWKEERKKKKETRPSSEFSLPKTLVFFPQKKKEKSFHFLCWEKNFKRDTLLKKKHLSRSFRGKWRFLREWCHVDEILYAHILNNPNTPWRTRENCAAGVCISNSITRLHRLTLTSYITLHVDSTHHYVEHANTSNNITHQCVQYTCSSIYIIQYACIARYSTT